MPQTTIAPARSTAREILRLAVPAFGALIAEPLFLLADSAIVGHLGVDQLAGVGLASTILHTAVGLMVFLAYSTTPAVARAIGDGKLGKALAAGRDGVWLALLLGLVLAVVGFVAAEPLVGFMGASGDVQGFAVDYLRWSMPGLAAMLLIFAGTGVLRGLQDTRTPLVVATAGFAVNIALNVFLVYGLNMSVTGSAIGTSIAQWAMAAVYLVMVGRNARQHGVSLRPDWHGIRAMTKVGSWLMLRTLSLRLAILATVLVVTAQGAVNLAAHQLAMTIFSFLAFALDALAIAAQALIGKELGARNAARARELTRTMIRWGTGFGVVTGILLAVAAPWVGYIFTADSGVRSALTVALWVLALGQPLAGYVFVLDGVLIGAGDARYLAIAGVVNLAVYLPLLVAVHQLRPGGEAGLLWLWAAFALGYMLARAVTLGLRARTDRWMVLGSH
ncbi:MATE family efflux transporter [Paenarthrobacter nicotinovorans]|uniref:MATE family efflux transporter n=1 Tax=Paenarthrobacter nicotinovorans TaxID=29320 RepID=UPI0007CC52FE|nr:MATE family efflux transporter [Paenarthrobacter nicotinovorans]MBP2394660.1 putative MATE family efflux protein [Paenarthrobacter nicotinovorans]UKE99165.1 MATE family efflux transporter [Paenarthrobacter nicotinovorans]UKF03945.1 MATE family efflux transporter [Paenarthrobacter nicotinovorans]GAT87300.1 multidrug transporter MatE [Paenarthrobacter nicotinovorans]GGV42624.1 MATE family efflux transporter [Paenarthrobacter nicotinovorans]